MSKVAARRTYLELTQPEQLRSESTLAEADRRGSGTARIERIECTPEKYRELYRLVGSDYHWRDRNTWSDEKLREHLADPRVSVHELRVDGKSAGYFELMHHDDSSVEIAYFGLAPAFIGQGLGKLLLTNAVKSAWSLGATRVWLHTCTLDHPSALPNYKARGFVVTKVEDYEAEIPDKTEVE